MSPDHETPRYCGRPLPASVRTVTNINSSTGHETPRCCGRPLPACVRTVTNINSSTGHETLRYCGRPLPATVRTVTEYRSRNISVLWQTVTGNCQDRYQHKLEYRSRNTSVLWQTVTATPFGIYNIIKGHTSTGRPTNSSITSQTTLYWGPACLTGNGFQTTPRTICDDICGQSCQKQIATKTHACLNQSGMGFGCDLLAGAQLLYHASCEKSRHMSTIVSRNVVARGIATRWA